MKTYFIHTVTTYAAAAKSRKGSILQLYAMTLRNKTISEHSLKTLVRQLELLVSALDSKFHGAQLSVDFRPEAQWISIRPYEPTSYSSPVCSISYANVIGEIEGQSIGKDIISILPSHDLVKLFIEKGGAK